MSKVLDPSPISEVSDIDSVSAAEDFLKTEYELLSKWEMHGEEATHRIFNFYVTLLTAVLGGLVVILELVSSTLRSSLFIIGGASALLIIVGVVFFDALITQYLRNAYYHIGILSIQAYYLHYPSVASILREHPPFSIEADAESPQSFVSRRLPFVKNVLPVGIQQIFMSLVNSLLVGALILCLVWGVGGTNFRPLETIIASIAGVLVSFLVHNLFARLIMQSRLDQVRDMVAFRETVPTTSTASEVKTTPPAKNSGSRGNKGQAQEVHPRLTHAAPDQASPGANRGTLGKEGSSDQDDSIANPPGG